MKLVMLRTIKRIVSARREGSAALITTIAISSILVVLFVGITTIATREIRQSISADQSSRALYAAEAGVEDAARQLSQNQSFSEPSCNSSTSGNEVAVGNNSNAAWTCRTVTTKNTVIEGRLNKDDAIQLNLGKATDVNNNPVQPAYAVVQWNKTGFDAADPVGALVNSSYLPAYSTASDWSRAAVMEMTLAWYPRSGQPLAGKTLNGAFPVRTVLASPVGSDTQANDISTWSKPNYPDATYNTTGLGTTNLASGVSTRCVTTSTYNCSSPYNANPDAATVNNTINLNTLAAAEIEDPSNYGQILSTSCNLESATGCSGVLRIRPRYASANFVVHIYYNDGGTLKPATMSDGYATIDVTARSSNNYRRVVAKKQLAASVYDGIFDNALFSGKDICKTMQIYKDNRGAPDYIQVVDPAAASGYRLQANPDAGKNTGCSSDTGV